MFAVNEYDEIINNEKRLNEKHIIVLLFVRPSLPNAMDVINEFNYIHYNSGKYCSIYAVGYSNDFSKENDNHYRLITESNYEKWFFSDQSFVTFKSSLEVRIKWEYSGEIEMLILQSSPDNKNILNFQNYVSIDIDHGIRKGYIASFNRFMESLIRASRYEVTTVEAINRVRRSRLKISSIVSDTIEDCVKVPTAVKNVIKDRLFIRPSNIR